MIPFKSTGPGNHLVSLFNPLIPGIHQKVIHNETNLQLKAAGFVKYAWPFSEHQAL